LRGAAFLFYRQREINSRRAIRHHGAPAIRVDFDFLGPPLLGWALGSWMMNSSLMSPGWLLASTLAAWPVILALLLVYPDVRPHWQIFLCLALWGWPLLILALWIWL